MRENRLPCHRQSETKFANWSGCSTSVLQRWSVQVSGERLVVPPTVYEVLKKVVELMAEGRSVTLLPDNQVVTTQRAADLLGMSRPFFNKLLENGIMAQHTVGKQRRV